MEGILTYAFVAILAVSSSFYQLVCLLYTCESCSVVSDSLWPHGLYSPWNSLGQNTEVGSLCLLPGIFPTQGSNPGLSHCRLMLYQLSHKGSPFYICVCVCININTYWSGLPFPSPGDLPDPGIEPGSPALWADALPSEPPGKPIYIYIIYIICILYIICIINYIDNMCIWHSVA